jgi:hypothetical protein
LSPDPSRHKTEKPHWEASAFRFSAPCRAMFALNLKTPSAFSVAIWAPGMFPSRRVVRVVREVRRTVSDARRRLHPGRAARRASALSPRGRLLLFKCARIHT